MTTPPMLETVRRVQVLIETDVLVCGGGPSGVVAAVAAARNGAHVTLVERWPRVGGMGTCALVTGWHRSDREKMVINGMVEEIGRRLACRDWIVQDGQFPFAHETHWFDPEGLTIVLHDLLEEAGVRTLCYTVAGEPVIEDGRIRGVLVETKQGTRAVLGRIVIDATGDGDIAAKSGVPFECGRADDGRVQGMTMMYRVCGIDEARLRSLPREAASAIDRAMREAAAAGELPPFNPAFSIGWMANRQIPNMCPVAGNPLEEEELTRLTAQSRRQVFAYRDWLRARVPGLERVEIEQTGHSLGIRESRRIRGRKTLSATMVLGAVKQPDAIGHGVWMVDIHDPQGTGYTTWNDRDASNMLPAGQSYHIPLGMCLNEQIPNLVVVGRCASSTHEGHSSVRVQTHCMAMAEGAGMAVAMALDAGVDPYQVDVRALQARLRMAGVYLEDVPGAAVDAE